MNITKETVKKLEELGYNVWGRKGMKDTDNRLSWQEADILVIYAKDFSSIKHLKTPKSKEITIDWVMRKLENGSVYINLSSYLRKSISMSYKVYAASYGIGIDTLGGYKHSAKEVESKLNELGIKFRNEFSDAAWVYRFIISKDSNNMRIFESLK